MERRRLAPPDLPESPPQPGLAPPRRKLAEVAPPPRRRLGEQVRAATSTPAKPEPPRKGETIFGCAVRNPTTGMYCYSPKPFRHGDVMHTMVERRVVEGVVPGDWEQGFVTSRFRFVGREEAMAVAKAASQLKRPQSGPELFSEDLW